MIDWKEDPHRRFNPLTREWVLVSPHRTQRPWQGQTEKVAAEAGVAYDPDCYLCPGNSRAGGVKNPQYETTFVFDNDFSALKPDTRVERVNEGGLLIAETEPGICRVVCFSPRHDLAVSRMSAGALRSVVDTWVEQYRELASRSIIRYVQIFENRGAMMGASNPHPHCQIWANHTLPSEIAKEQSALLEYSTRQRQCLLCDYLKLERERAERVVCANAEFTALVPFWAVWPFETLVIGNSHIGGMDGFGDAQRTALGDILKRVTTRYDNVFETPFPYTMGFHQKPSDGDAHPEWHFHAHFYPPLLRSATVRKFMVGYEMLATPQRDITAEMAAARLREAGERHYMDM